MSSQGRGNSTGARRSASSIGAVQKQPDREASSLSAYEMAMPTPVILSNKPVRAVHQAIPSRRPASSASFSSTLHQQHHNNHYNNGINNRASAISLLNNNGINTNNNNNTSGQGNPVAPSSTRFRPSQLVLDLRSSSSGGSSGYWDSISVSGSGPLSSTPMATNNSERAGPNSMAMDIGNNRRNSLRPPIISRTPTPASVAAGSAPAIATAESVSGRSAKSMMVVDDTMGREFVSRGSQRNSAVAIGGTGSSISNTTAAQQASRQVAASGRSMSNVGTGRIEGSRWMQGALVRDAACQTTEGFVPSDYNYVDWKFPPAMTEVEEDEMEMSKLGLLDFSSATLQAERLLGLDADTLLSGMRRPESLNLQQQQQQQESVTMFTVIPPPGTHRPKPRFGSIVTGGLMSNVMTGTSGVHGRVPRPIMVFSQASSRSIPGTPLSERSVSTSSEDGSSSVSSYSTLPSSISSPNSEKVASVNGVHHGHGHPHPHAHPHACIHHGCGSDKSAFSIPPAGSLGLGSV
ncbi:hypothetical protein HDU76_003478 [Blyttiomyces sp. JEL0837]|nr:hypothetical protein HDU76_003478 [Blyttiomyces sp. JEL0837]